MSRLIEYGAEVADSALAAIMIHGRGHDADEMAALAATLAVDGIRFYCPQAPERSWYPARFIDPFEANQPALDQSLAAIEAELEALHFTGFSDERIVLCGFSQGGCLAAQMLLRCPSDYAAALLFTSGLIGPPGTTWRSPGRLSGVARPPHRFGDRRMGPGLAHARNRGRAFRPRRKGRDGDLPQPRAHRLRRRNSPRARFACRLRRGGEGLRRGTICLTGAFAQTYPQAQPLRAG